MKTTAQESTKNSGGPKYTDKPLKELMQGANPCPLRSRQTLPLLGSNGN